MTITTLVALLLSFGITFFIIPQILKIAQQKQLYDLPNNRKEHLKPIPALGGISFFISFWIVIFAVGDLTLLKELRLLVVGSFLLLIVGIKDDLIEVKALTKLFWQLFVGALLFAANFRMTGLYGLFGIAELPIYASFFLTILTVAFLINAFNLVDGINGLAGSLTLFGVGGFGFLFWQAGLYNWTLVSVVMIGILLAFLKYNFGKADIFMGDNGSTFLGLIMSALFIKLVNISPEKLPISPLLIGLSLVVIPTFDLLRVFAVRILQGGSPFRADRNHLHHLLRKMGKSHRWVVLVTLLLHGLIISWVLLSQEATTLSFIAWITLFLLAFTFVLKISQGLTAIKKTEAQRHRIGYIE